MKKRPKTEANIDDLSTWVKYRKILCEDCVSSCCTLPVEVQARDLVRIGVMDEFELEDNMKTIARRLMKAGVVEHFHAKTTTFTLVRMANGDCLYLDAVSRRCTNYQNRPDTCRNHPHIGPRPGYCAFRSRLNG